MKLKFIVLLNVHATRLFRLVEVHIMNIVGFKGKCSMMRRIVHWSLSDGDLRRSYQIVEQAQRSDLLVVRFVMAWVHRKFSLFDVVVIVFFVLAFKSLFKFDSNLLRFSKLLFGLNILRTRRLGRRLRRYFFYFDIIVNLI